MKIKKKRTMVISKKENSNVSILVNDQAIDRVSRFKYLGSVVSEDGRSLEAVKVRIVLAKDAFSKRRELLTKRMSRSLKRR